MPSEEVIKTAKVARWISQSSPLTGIGMLSLTGLLLLYSSGACLAAKVDAGVARLCDRAAISASRSKGVPLDVLQAISRTETGRSVKSRLQPWPWTVNMEGAGHWFSTLDEARSYVFLHFKNGARSFDVGCFQINYKWHGDAFRSIDDMFDPELNAQYAAEFLTELYQEFGNWPDAAGAYHSRTPKFAEKYAARFDRIRAELPDLSDPILTRQALGVRPTNPTNRNLIPTTGPGPLMRSGTISLGSLVPIDRHPNTTQRPFVVIK